MNQNRIYKSLNDYRLDNKLFKGGCYLLDKNKTSSYPETVSVITICKNAEKTIQKTIDSVKLQSYKKLEFIIIDGNSTDTTVEILQKNSDHIDLWISEPDLGPADAINKALHLFSGEYFFILAADDEIPEMFFEHATSLLKKNPEYSFVYGDLKLSSENGTTSLQKGDTNYRKKIKYFMPKINQPSIVFRREFYDLVGDQNILYKVAPDYDWLLRGHLNGLRGLYSDKLIVKFSVLGNSNIYFTKGLEDVKNISIRHGGSFFLSHLLYFTRRIYRLLKSSFA